jgi:hypothetical protein
MTVTRVLDGLRQTRLRRAAVRYAEHGWDVVPGAVRCGDRFRCVSRCPTIACHPDWAGWEQTATRDPSWVAALWAFRPRAILLATGAAFDVLEVPACLGTGGERGAGRGPVAVTGTGRWMFLVRPGGALGGDFANRPDVVLHGRGSWIPAPPTLTLDGRVRWLVDPEEVSWRLPDAQSIQAKLAGARRARERRSATRRRVARSASDWREAPT